VPACDKLISMRVCCVQNADEIRRPCPDVIVFPEYSELSELIEAQSKCTDSIVVGTVVEEDRISGKLENRGRGVLLHHGLNQIDYLKIETDSSGTTGVHKRPESLPVYEFDDVCIGVLICVDLVKADFGGFGRDVIQQVRSSRATFKIVCVPAAMTSIWNWSEPLESNYRGVYIVLCNNHTKSYQPRCNSFIAGPDGKKIIEEPNASWPISASFT